MIVAPLQPKDAQVPARRHLQIHHRPFPAVIFFGLGVAVSGKMCIFAETTKTEEQHVKHRELRNKTY
jgi:hypothetical protein